jgi:hypothetical protein
VSVNEGRICAACGAKAPPTETEYTLIGSKHAWRCRKAPEGEGPPRLEWYCPVCWKNLRSQ